MQALIELLANFIAMLVVAALAQFGVQMERPVAPKAEVHRVSECPKAEKTSMIAAKSTDEC